MSKPTRTMAIRLERTIPAPPAVVFDAWKNPKVPGTPWHEGDKLILNAKVDGLFYWYISGTAHYGRFTEIARPSRLQHTWMSQYTGGHESTVTVTFQKKGAGTRMILVHAGLPDAASSKAHTEGWTYFLDKLAGHFSAKA